KHIRLGSYHGIADSLHIGISIGARLNVEAQPIVLQLDHAPAEARSIEHLGSDRGRRTWRRLGSRARKSDDAHEEPETGTENGYAHVSFFVLRCLTPGARMRVRSCSVRCVQWPHSRQYHS